MAKNRVLVIAGSDSSGGACDNLCHFVSMRQLTNCSRGLEADQKVLATHGCYAMTATTALTAQNTLGVHDIHVIPSEFVTKQIDACLEDIGADVVKLGKPIEGSRPSCSCNLTFLTSARFLRYVGFGQDSHRRYSCSTETSRIFHRT